MQNIGGGNEEMRTKRNRDWWRTSPEDPGPHQTGGGQALKPRAPPETGSERNRREEKEGGQRQQRRRRWTLGRQRPRAGSRVADGVT